MLEQGFQRAGDDPKLQAFGPVVLDLMRGAAELAETTDYRVDEPTETAPTSWSASGTAPSLVLRLNRPEARNALTPALLGGLGAALVEAEADPEVRAVVLTGTGDRAFCAGMDLRSFAGGERHDRRRRRGPWPASCACWPGEVAVPMVGRGQRHRLAGGFELLLGLRPRRRLVRRPSSGCPR